MDIHNLDFNHLKKNIKKAPDSPIPGATKIALLADSASQLIVQSIQGYAIENGTSYEIFEANYNQINSQVFDPSSELYRFEPEFVVIIRSTEPLLDTFYKAPPRQKPSFATDQATNFNNLYQAITGTLKARVIFANFPEVDDGVFGNYANKTSYSFLFQLRKLNVLLMEMARTHSDLYICDVATLVNRVGYASAFDPKLYISASMVFTLEFLPWLAKSIYDIIQTTKGQFKKCIILDLDNTIWGGTIGDDGLEGVHIGELGLGKIFSGFQRWVKELVRRGILLAICTKNAEEMARSLFLEHPDMILKMEDIAIFVANWENKVDNIQHIHEVLNIGFDAMVFLDDSPFEREMVARAIPEITVPALPEDPAQWLIFLRELNLFETASFTEEDKVRNAQYQEQAKRAALQKTYKSEDEFLQSLQMSSLVRSFDSFTIPRIAQLSQRSNQFNLRTIRYSEAELTALAADPRYLALSFTLQDIHGDYGLVAFAVLKQEKDGLFIENWVMSCRVLKRGMEKFMLECLVEEAMKRGYNRMIGEYLPTQKNGLVKDHYKKLGFTPADAGRWTLELEGWAGSASIPSIGPAKGSPSYATVPIQKK